MRILLAVPLFAAIPVLGQNGPGGVGGSGSNVLWLSADKTVYNNAGTVLANNGDNVQQWNDRSGNGKNASEGTAGNRPNYYTNVVNGFPVIRYTAANTDRLLATGLSTSNQASVWVVANYASLPSSNPGLLQGAASGKGFSSLATDKNIGMWVNSTNSQIWGRGIQSNGTQIQIPQTTTLSTGTFYTFNNNYDGTNIIQYVDNTTAGSVAYNGTLSSWTDFAIGVQAGTETWNGDIAEVIAFNTSLNPAQRIIVANYLAAKYGLALGTNDVYSQDNAGQGNCDFDVAGIGQVTGAAQNQTDSRGSGIIEITNPGNLNDNEFLMWGHDNGTLGTWGVTDKPAGVQGRWARVWRASERNTTNTASVDVGAVDIIFDLTGLGSVTASQLRLIVDSDNDNVFADETPISGATSLGSNRYQFAGVTAITNNRRFTLGTTNVSTTPLPVELLSFSAEAVDQHTARLEWSTASELNNDHFTIERSTDAATWSSALTVPAVGNSATVSEYATNDAAAPGGVCYYRLRQTDMDGGSTLSDMVVVDLGRPGFMDPLIYPNPGPGSFNVFFPEPPNGPLSFGLVDAAGRTVAAHIGNGGVSGAFTVDMGSPAPGLYRLNMMADGVMIVRAVSIGE